METKDKYYNQIKEKLINEEVYAAVKDYSKERHKVITYYEIGELLSKAGKDYGKDIIGQYSEKLVIEVGRKYTRSSLFRMRQLYELFTNEKIAPAVRLLTWTHCLLLFSIRDIDQINYYINQVVARNLSKRQLQEIIKNKEYERLPKETKQKLIEQKETNINDLVKDPIIIKNINNYEKISEKALQELILNDIPSFLDELGNGFTFIRNEYKIKIGNTNNYIDLLLFNIEYNCYIVVELKVTPLKKEHIGQIEIYMNYIDMNLKKAYHDKTIGIIICKKNNKYVIEYASDKRIFAKEYELV